MPDNTSEAIALAILVTYLVGFFSALCIFIKTRSGPLGMGVGVLAGLIAGVTILCVGIFGDIDATPAVLIVPLLLTFFWVAPWGLRFRRRLLSFLSRKLMKTTCRIVAVSGVAFGAWKDYEDSSSADALLSRFANAANVSPTWVHPGDSVEVRVGADYGFEVSFEKVARHDGSVIPLAFTVEQPYVSGGQYVTVDPLSGNKLGGPYHNSDFDTPSRIHLVLPKDSELAGKTLIYTAAGRGRLPLMGAVVIDDGHELDYKYLANDGFLRWFAFESVFGILLLLLLPAPKIWEAF
jgi:hypothetical protein